MKLIVFVSLLSLSICAEERQQIISMSRTEIEHMKRAPARDQLLKNAERIVDLTKDGEAREILQFLKDRHILGLISSNGTSVLEPINPQSIIAFAPIFPEDVKYYLAMKPLVGESRQLHASVFGSEKRMTLAIRFDYKMSWFAEGIIVLHEGKHAKNLFTRGYAISDAKKYCAEEVEVRDFDRRLQALVGKSHYENVIDHCVKKIKRDLKIHNLEVGEAFCDLIEYDDELDMAFGKAESDRDRSGRSIWIHIDSNFRLLEAKFSGDELKKVKIDFLRSMMDETKREYIKE
jgi:hypothetical protein